MVAPLEHRDSEPLESIIVSLQDSITREQNFQGSLLWKIRVLEREIQYYEQQVGSFSRILEVPREIISLKKESQALDFSLVSERDRFRSILGELEGGDLRRMGQLLLHDLDTELSRESSTKHQEAITHILEAYVDTGMRYMENCQSLVEDLTRRIKNLKNELALSQQEELKQKRMYEFSIQFGKDHEEATYGDFRAHVMHLLGVEMEKELKHAIERVPKK
jgi:hypothetical protein